MTADIKLEEPTTLEGEEWLLYIITNGFKLTPEIERFIIKRWKNMPTDRENSVAYYLNMLSKGEPLISSIMQSDMDSNVSFIYQKKYYNPLYKINRNHKNQM